MQGHEQRENTCQRAGHPEHTPTNLAVLPDHELVARGQSELVERQAARDRFARLTCRAEFLIPSPHCRSPDIRGSRRAARSHYRIRDGKVRSEGEISGARDGAKNADAHEWSNLDLLRLDVFQYFGRNAFLQLRAKYSCNRNHDHPGQLQRSFRPNDDSIPMNSVRYDRHYYSVTNLEIAVVQALADCGSDHRVLRPLAGIARRRGGLGSCRRGNELRAGDQKSRRGLSVCRRRCHGG